MRTPRIDRMRERHFSTTPCITAEHLVLQTQAYKQFAGDAVPVFRAKVVDTTLTSFIFEITGNSDKVDRFIALMRECGLVEVGRTGVVAIARGSEAL